MERLCAGHFREEDMYQTDHKIMLVTGAAPQNWEFALPPGAQGSLRERLQPKPSRKRKRCNKQEKDRDMFSADRKRAEHDKYPCVHTAELYCSIRHILFYSSRHLLDGDTAAVALRVSLVRMRR
jgi:hypothetical protein